MFTAIVQQHALSSKNMPKNGENAYTDIQRQDSAMLKRTRIWQLEVPKQEALYEEGSSEVSQGCWWLKWSVVQVGCLGCAAWWYSCVRRTRRSIRGHV
jgi:hypothetical protein